jgi:hypothetical protein
MTASTTGHASRGRSGARTVFVLLATLLLGLTACSSKARDGSTAGARRTPPAGTAAAPGTTAPPRWLVALGDSYISGEGARWAANTSGRPGPVDALGRGAYLKAGHRGQPGCDRASASVAALGAGRLRGANLACSGATTRSHWSGAAFTPGLDFYSDGEGHVGQLVALRRFAAHHRVSDVVVSIGGNDFGFGSVLGRCTAAFVLTVTRNASLCKHDPALHATFAPGHVARITRDIAAALARVRTAMQGAGHDPADYSVVVVSYPSPLPPGPRIRYSEDLLHRAVLGGCPIFDADATWANRVVLTGINSALQQAVDDSSLANIAWVDMSDAFAGHRLCERGAAQLQETGLASWRSPGARARLEWVNMVYAKSTPWQSRESLHPNYWGVRAERRCLRAAVSGARAHSGTCRDGRFSAAS